MAERGAGRPRGRHRHALWFRLHQRPWRMRRGALVAAFAGGDPDFHDGWFRHGVRGAPCAGRAAAMNILFSFIAGLVFGLGLIVSELANPAKIIGFLDLAGAWDPSLALVMAGAVTI